MTKREALRNMLRVAKGEQAVIAGTADERDQDREDAITTIANVLHWPEREVGGADPEDALDMALHHFVVERADAPGWERIKAMQVDAGERGAGADEHRADRERHDRLRDWMPPPPRVNAAQLELPNCQALDPCRIIKELVAFWRDQEVAADTVEGRSFYVSARRRGERFLVARGWRYLPTVPDNQSPPAL